MSGVCACRCGTPTTGTWAPGHDTKARNEVMHRNFGTVRELGEHHGVPWPEGEGPDLQVWGSVLEQYPSTLEFVRRWQ